MPVESLFRSVNYAFRTSHAERDASMKRQLVEDLKTRLKFLQEMEKSYRGQVEDLEKKVGKIGENSFHGAVFTFLWE